MYDFIIRKIHNTTNFISEATKVIKQEYGFQSELISDLDYQSAMTALKREILDDDRLELLQRIADSRHQDVKIEEIGAVNMA